MEAFAIAVFLERQTNIAGGLPLVNEPGWSFRLMTVFTMTTGTMFLVWLGERITERGIGNGMALIVFAGIVVNFPTAVLITLDRMRSGQMGLFGLLALTIMMVAVMGTVVFIWRGHRRVSVQFAKRLVGRHTYGRTTTYLPLNVNTSGIIPLIVAFNIVPIAVMAVGTFPGPWAEAIRENLQNGMPLYYLLYMGVVAFFTFFYTAIVFNPDDVAENLQKYGGVVPGIRPGKRTAEYIDTILTRTTLVWAIGLALVAVLPDLMIVGFRAHAVPVIGEWLDVNLPRFITEGLGVTFYFGGIPLLILVGVALDTTQQVKSQLIRRSAQSGSVEGADVDYETFVPVLTLPGAATVPVVESVLQSVGVRFVIKNEGVQDLFGLGRVGTGFNVFAGAPTVCVETTRAEEAAALLASIESEQRIGTVVHYFAKPEVGVVRLAADLEIGETLRFRRRGADFQQVVRSMQIDHRPVQTAAAATNVAVKVDQRVHAGTHVYRVTEPPV